MHQLPLAGRRIIELGSMVAAPFATHILSQLGAEIIKVEPPAGDPTRKLVRGGPSGTFIAYNHGKRSICLNLSHEGGRDVLYQLLKSADGLVHNLAPKAAAKLGVSREACAAINPNLVYCHIRGYGPGPQEDDLASNPVAEAATGVMESNRVNGRPSRLGPSYHDQFAGTYAVIGMLGSFLQRAENRSQDRHVEVGLYETGLHIAARDLVGVQLKTQLLGRAEREPSGEFSMPGYGAYITRDEKWIYLMMLTDAHWEKFCEALQLPLVATQQFGTLRERKKGREAVEEMVRDAVRCIDFDDAMLKLKTAGVGATEVLPLERVLEAPQARQPGKLRAVKFRDLDFEIPEFPQKISGKNSLQTLAPAEIGQHTREILRELGIDDHRCEALIANGAVVDSTHASFSWAPVRK